MIRKIKNTIRKFVFRFIKPDTKVEYVKNTYSQAGEDIIMQFLFGSVGIAKPVYLDIGVYYPDTINNTFLFYQNGSRGVCVEADETLIPLIRQKRPGDMVLHAGIGIIEHQGADFYIFSERALNTFDREEAENRASSGMFKIEKVSKVVMKTINSVIEEHFSVCPDLLSIDIEGLDLDVLKTLDHQRFPIPVICVETCTYSEDHIKPKDEKIREYLESAGYFVYADTYINTIFVNKNWFSTR